MVYQRPIYLDYNATTAHDPEVVAATGRMTTLAQARASVTAIAAAAEKLRAAA